MPPPALPPPRAPASRLFVVLSVTVAAVVIVAALVGFSLWKDRQPDDDGLANDVLDSMNQYLASDQQYQKVGLHVATITVIRAAGNMFEGQATVATNTGDDHTVPVHITYNGDAMLWRTDPGAFAFTVQEQLQGAS